MQIISWNVNGLNSACDKGANKFILQTQPDIMCMQEIKVSEKTAKKEYLEYLGYTRYWNQADKNGYSGVMTLTKAVPLCVQEDMGIEEFDKEGRLITCEYDKFYVINAYIPNSGRELLKLDFKIRYNNALIEFMNQLRETKPVILCGDLNVSHKELDLANPKSNRKTAGFTDEERASFSKLLDEGYTDTFRLFTKEGGHYSYWSYRAKAREKNVGWRLDYFVVSNDIVNRVKVSEILPDILGSDHCPIRLTLDL